MPDSVTVSVTGVMLLAGTDIVSTSVLIYSFNALFTICVFELCTILSTVSAREYTEPNTNRFDVTDVVVSLLDESSFVVSSLVSASPVVSSFPVVASSDLLLLSPDVFLVIFFEAETTVSKGPATSPFPFS